MLWNKLRIKAMERKAGARGLRSILENALLETMYELPSIEGVRKKVIVDGSVITEGARPLYVYEEETRTSCRSGFFFLIVQLVSDRFDGHRLSTKCLMTLMPCA